MSSKKCFKCGDVKLLSSFYKHPQMGDGHLNKCKSCARSDVRSNRKENVDYYREYDRDRGNRQGYQYTREYREKYPNKYRAHNLVNNSIRDKKLFKKPCEICGTEKDIHAHHDDYLEPLNVRWLCCAHHSQWHKENGEAKNP
jgi:hypothetical protein